MPKPATRLALVVAIGLAAAPAAEAQFCPGPQPEAEPNDTTAQATPLTAAGLTFGDQFLPSPGSTAPGDVDFFSVALEAGSRLWLLVDTGFAQGPGATRDSVVQLLNPDGSLLEADDDDGTGMNAFTVSTTESSTIAGRLIPATGTYFIRVAARNPALPMAYRLLSRVTSGTSTPETEPNNTFAQAQGAPLTVEGTLTPGDVDCFAVNILDHGVPLILADGWPETSLSPVDLSLTMDLWGLGPVTVNSSDLSARPAEAVMANIITNVCVSGASVTPGNASYRMAFFYSGECALSVTLQSFEVR